MEDSNLTTPIQSEPPVAVQPTEVSPPQQPAQQASSNAITDQMFNSGPSKSLMVLLVVLIVIVLIGGVYLYIRLQNENSQKAVSEATNAQVAQDIDSLKNDLGSESDEATASEDLTQLEKDLSEL